MMIIYKVHKPKFKVIIKAMILGSDTILIRVNYRKVII